MTIRPATLVALCVAFMAILAPATRAADRSNCQLKKYGDVEFITNNEGMIFVPVMVNDKPAHMLLNIGAPFTLIFKRSMQEFSLPARNVSTTSGIKFGSRYATDGAEVRSLTVGTLKLGGGVFLVAPAKMKIPGDDVAGILGIDVFKHVDLELDIAHKRLGLFSQEHCPNVGTYWSNAYASMPILQSEADDWYVPVELDGKKVAASLSSTIPETSLTTDATQKLYGFDEKSQGVQTETDASGKPTKTHFRAMQLTAPGLTVKNSNITLHSPPNCPLFIKDGVATYGDTCAGAYPLHLGLRVLKDLRLYFSTKEKMLYFTAADTAK